MNNKELNKAQVEQLTNQVESGELNDEDLENVDGGFFGFYDPYSSFYPVYPQPMDAQTFIDTRIYGDPTGTDDFIKNVIWG